MSLFSFRSSAPKPIAIADIESGGVSVAIALAHREKPFEIVALGESRLSFEDRTDAATIAALPNQIDEAGTKALAAYAELQKIHGPVRQTFAIINAPWARSQTVRIISQLDAETTITEDMIAALAKQALEESTEINPRHLLEASVVRLELNGYPTVAPAGKRAHKISLYALMSDCDPEVHIRTQEGLQKIFAAPVAFRSQLRTVISVVEAMPDLPKDYTLLDVSREATTIANIHTGLSMAHRTVPEGLRSIVRRAAGKRMPEETLALLRMLADDTCDSGACAAIQSAASAAEPELVRVFADAMAELAAKRYLPPSLILLCDDALAPWLTELFSRIDFTQFTTTTQPFKVEALNAASLRSFVASRMPIDERLSLAAALVDIEEK